MTTNIDEEASSMMTNNFEYLEKGDNVDPLKIEEEKVKRKVENDNKKDDIDIENGKKVDKTEEEVEEEISQVESDKTSKKRKKNDHEDKELIVESDKTNKKLKNINDADAVEGDEELLEQTKKKKRGKTKTLRVKPEKIKEVYQKILDEMLVKSVL